ncbi:MULTISPECIES: hypothetical protein [Pseudomonas]|uniref:Glycoprotein gp2 n=1 Tax=Pseudomonas psychrophila TaxID=122355 RepID=A0ABY0VZ39_9PSED|nr:MULTISPECIES: hypothetical protein [Pseudomonas]KAB0489884.1 hypothetical protein F7Q95_13395 [Pseudomonas psychrophila]KMN01599.1 hypothetical protein TU76_08245 [Pseudomonas psychrophila]KOX62570.1 hypothetical protein AA303_23830 [Pseudomonas psychrophila]MDY7580855.1 hypothetical protein [Pseudomonas sp. CCI3.1]MEB0065811.1 hypothetical protein [Pseudomonas sp. CCI3.1]
MHPLLSKTAAVLVVSALAQGISQAALFAVDTGPYIPANGGFAAWYQDSHGRTLDLCLSKAVSSRVPGTPGAPTYMCNLLPTPGVFDDAQPVVFPTNFPDEAFWFTADAAIVDAARGIDLSYGSAIEAAFAAEEPVEGDQVSFARVRIRVDVPVAGTYVITHPYGIEVFNIDTPGRRAINMTRDIGIGSPKTYDGALKGDVGPFLRSVNGPYTETNPVSGGAEQFIGDPNLNEAVTGSPFNTNYIRIEGPGGLDLRSTVFAISGKLSAVVRPTPLITQRSTYSRRQGASAPIAQQDVFVLAPPPPATVSLSSSTPALKLTEADTTGNWYVQSSINPTLPTTLQVTADNHLAIASSTPTTLPMALTDLVVIQRAEYSLSSGQLTLVASTSDETSPPALTATSGTGAAIGALSGSAAVKTLTTGISPIPPAKVRVTSSNGGSDTEEVVIVQ